MSQPTVARIAKRLTPERLDAEAARVRRDIGKCRTQQEYNRLREQLDILEAETARRAV
jgi:hypothetical protein